LEVSGEYRGSEARDHRDYDAETRGQREMVFRPVSLLWRIITIKSDRFRIAKFLRAPRNDAKPRVLMPSAHCARFGRVHSG
jgi:hypothetical protein